VCGVISGKWQCNFPNSVHHQTIVGMWNSIFLSILVFQTFTLKENGKGKKIKGKSDNEKKNRK
jgi:hypothetical protein